MLKKNTIQIIAPARLHFGFLELNNNSGAFGGIGLSIDKFNTKIRVKKNIGAKFKGKALDKASFFLKKFCKKNKIKPNFFLNIEKATPSHIGLGSGTQLALSIGSAISQLNNVNLDLEKIAKILNRSLRSNVGLINFKHGGFLIDLKIKNKSFSNINKVFFL
jgi:beta-RFAP synthase